MHNNPYNELSECIFANFIATSSLCHVYDHCMLYYSTTVRRRKVSTTDEEVERMEISGDSLSFSIFSIP